MQSKIIWGKRFAEQKQASRFSKHYQKMNLYFKITLTKICLKLGSIKIKQTLLQNTKTPMSQMIMVSQSQSSYYLIWVLDHGK